MRPRPKTSFAATDAAFILPARVYYEDTDAAGVVYYANYLRFCERARTEWLRALGFEQQVMLKSCNTAFVVRSIEARYLAPARLDDALSVVSRIEDLGRASLVFAQQVLRDDQVLFDSHISVACVDTARGRPTQIPTALRASLSATKPS